MASTYFHGGSEIQADTLQTLYLMNLNYVGYPDSHHHQQQQPPPGNMLFLNSATTGASHAPPHHNQHFFCTPLPAASSEDQNRHEIPVLHGAVPRFHYNVWGSTDESATNNHPQIPAAVDFGSQMGFRRPVVVSPTQQQGLSLSLSPQRAAYKSFSDERDVQMQAPVTVISPASGNDIRGSGGSSSSVSNGMNGMQSVILGSKYLKAAQQILDEVVNVGKGIKVDSSEEGKSKGKMERELTAAAVAVAGKSSGGGESSKTRVAELTTAQRQELQMKKAKLVSMLDEVEQRYRQYHQQMQLVVASFEQAAGFGSAKSYTALALQTISKQFRCLKDAISSQIKATSKSLGEEDCLEGKVEGSRLKLVDHQIRQQRALQQLGMIQHNAWRPQRGLPERAVSVLRAWLFEHFLHPYPKDSDKHMLAKQTGLTRSQVSNWFINARVRLWKPMVEEMYNEETKDEEQNGTSEDNTGKTGSNKELGSKSTAPQEIANPVRMDKISSFKSTQEKAINYQNASPNEVSNSPPPFRGPLQAQVGFPLNGSSDMDKVLQRSPKKPRSYDMQNSPSSILSMDMDMKPGESMNDKFGREKQSKNTYHPFMGGTGTGTGTGTTTSVDNGFGAYSIGEFGRFNPEQLGTRFHGNGVSLTLGLPHCENLSLSGTQQDYIPNQHIQLGSRLQMGSVDAHYNGISSTPQPSHSSIAYEDMNIQNRKRFAAQLLPDFVA